MPQYTFTSDENLIKEVDFIADKEKRSRSVMIDLLLRLAVKEKTRKRRAEKNNSEHHTRDMGESNPTG